MQANCCACTFIRQPSRVEQIKQQLYHKMCPCQNGGNCSSTYFGYQATLPPEITDGSSCECYNLRRASVHQNQRRTRKYSPHESSSNYYYCPYLSNDVLTDDEMSEELCSCLYDEGEEEVSEEESCDTQYDTVADETFCSCIEMKGNISDSRRGQGSRQSYTTQSNKEAKSTNVTTATKPVIRLSDAQPRLFEVAEEDKVPPRLSLDEDAKRQSKRSSYVGSVNSTKSQLQQQQQQQLNATRKSGVVDLQKSEFRTSQNVEFRSSQNGSSLQKEKSPSMQDSMKLNKVEPLLKIRSPPVSPQRQQMSKEIFSEFMDSDHLSLKHAKISRMSQDDPMISQLIIRMSQEEAKKQDVNNVQMYRMSKQPEVFDPFPSSRRVSRDEENKGPMKLDEDSDEDTIQEEPLCEERVERVLQRQQPAVQKSCMKEKCPAYNSPAGFKTKCPKKEQPAKPCPGSVKFMPSYHEEAPKSQNQSDQKGNRCAGKCNLKLSQCEKHCQLLGDPSNDAFYTACESLGCLSQDRSCHDPMCPCNPQYQRRSLDQCSDLECPANRKLKRMAGDAKSQLPIVQETAGGRTNLQAGPAYKYDDPMVNNSYSTSKHSYHILPPVQEASKEESSIRAANDGGELGTKHESAQISTVTIPDELQGDYENIKYNVGQQFPSSEEVENGRAKTDSAQIKYVIPLFSKTAMRSSTGNRISQSSYSSSQRRLSHSYPLNPRKKSPRHNSSINLNSPRK